MTKYVVAILLTLGGCSSVVGDTRSAPEMIAAGEARGDPEAGFWRYGPFTFVGKYRIEHQWVGAYPRAAGGPSCSYAWEGETKDRYGRRAPIKAGLDMWEENGVLYQKDYNPRTGLPRPRNMTDYVIGKYRPNYPGGPIYEHERLCRTYFEPYASEYEIWLKKTSLAAMRERDQDDLTKRWKYARLLKPLKYESITFANQRAERVTWTYAFAPKGLENVQHPWSPKTSVSPSATPATYTNSRSRFRT